MTFAFSLPPESVSVDIPQRVNVTKTFGGLFVDDYGIDSAKITISGSTGNSQFKEVYADGTSRKLTGKSESYLILEEIMQYKRSRSGYENFELRLYDLSAMADRVVAFQGEGKTYTNTDGWRVILESGKVNRSKSKPMFYEYTLNFIGIEPLGTKRYADPTSRTSSTKIGTPSQTNQKSVFEKVFDAINEIKKGSDSMKKTLTSYKSVIDKIKLVEEVTDLLEANIRSYYKVVQGFVDTTIDGVNSVFDIASFPADLAEDLVSAGTSLRESLEIAWVDIQLDWASTTSTDSGSRWDRIAQMWSDMFSIEGFISSMSSEAKATGSLPRVLIVPAGAAGSTDAVNETDPDVPASVSYLLTYGYYEITATSETRFDVISNQVYGSPDYADTLAAYNGITGDSEIVPGMILRVPYLSFTPALRDNEVYDLGQNAYGTDILLGSDGDVVLAEFNDYAIVSGLDNIGQAINLRITEVSGARVRLENYGIKNTGGGYDAFSMAVLTTSIKDTLVQDPRIRSVRDFFFDSVGDGMAVSFYVELDVGGVARFTMNL
jgi:hypothetical protein